MSRGFTLLEALVCTTLFLLALGLCGQLAVFGVKTRRQQMDQNGAFRQVVTLFYQLQRDLQLTRQLYSPDLSNSQPQQPGSQAASLVLVVAGSDGVSQVVAWQQRGSELQRWQYRPDFNPSDPASQQPLANELPKRVGGVDKFLVQLEPRAAHHGQEVIRFRLECSRPGGQIIVGTQLLSR